MRNWGRNREVDSRSSQFHGYRNWVNPVLGAGVGLDREKFARLMDEILPDAVGTRTAAGQPPRSWNNWAWAIFRARPPALSTTLPRRQRSLATSPPLLQWQERGPRGEVAHGPRRVQPRRQAGPGFRHGHRHRPGDPDRAGRNRHRRRAALQPQQERREAGGRLHQLQLGRRAVAIQGNLEIVGDCRRVVDEAAAFLGGLNGLVNNAGITTTVDFLEVSEEQFNRSYHLNIRGQFFSTQQAVRHIVERGRELQETNPEGRWARALASTSPRSTRRSAHPAIRCTRAPRGRLTHSPASWRSSCSRSTSGRTSSLPGRSKSPRAIWRKSADYSREVGGTRSSPGAELGLPEDVGYLAAYLISNGSRIHDRVGALLRRRPHGQDVPPQGAQPRQNEG